jgi:CRISPR-associated protein Csx17
LVAEARSTLSDGAAEWIDAAATLARGGLAFPPLLGSGGNDGNLDFSTTVFQALLALIDLNTGAGRPGAHELLEAAVLGRARPNAASGAISQFAAADSGGLNAGSGFDGAATGNLWDVVLGFEGAILLSSSAARRLGLGEASGGAFPFMIPRGGALSAGAGGVGTGDEATARGEFWAPLWDRPTGLDELAGLFREGRAVVKRRGARNSLDFARAVAQLGVSRGLGSFDRHAFEQRNGNMYVGVALPRRHVPREATPDLVADLDRGRWLDTVRTVMREKKGAAALQVVGRRLDDALYRLAGDVLPDAVQEGLIAVGAVSLECARRPRLRATDEGRRPLTPPPPLSAQWRTLADDGTAEFKLAAALAGLTAEATPDARGDVMLMPFRAHLAPLTAGRRLDQWAKGTAAEALVVWRGRDLHRDATAMLDRRLVEAQRHNFVRRVASGTLTPELPLRGWPNAPLWAVTAFLAGEVDLDRIAALVAGLAWVAAPPFGNNGAVPDKTAAARETVAREHPIPYAYAAIKALMRPGGILTEEQVRALLKGEGARRVSGRSPRLVDPLGATRLVAAGRVADAVRVARSLAIGVQLRTPFSIEGSTFDTMGLSAALAFPISDLAFAVLTDRAYPDLSDTSSQKKALP